MAEPLLLMGDVDASRASAKCCKLMMGELRFTEYGEMSCLVEKICAVERLCVRLLWPAGCRVNALASLLVRLCCGHPGLISRPLLDSNQRPAA